MPLNTLRLDAGTLPPQTGHSEGLSPTDAAPVYVPAVALAVYAAAALSLGAALVHLWVAPGYFEVWWGYGSFFLAAASAQGLFAIALLRWPGRTLPLAGIFGNLAVVALYVVTRTSGVPFGPHATRAEEAGVLDMATTAAELAAVVLLLSLLGGRARGVAVNAVLLAGVGFWVLRLTGYLS
jgi:ABC-type transport system involved in cytochrome c biogenesis permease subunit